MLHILTNIFVFLLTVFILITVHELGHFVVAKFFNVKVIRFSIGFGKALWRFYDKQGTEYVIAIIPLGGYVKLLDSREDKIKPAEKSLAFDSKPINQRCAILSAGVIMNVIFAILAYWLAFSLGVTHVKAIVGTVAQDSIAAQAGIRSGDHIVAVGGDAASSWSAVSMRLISHYGDAKPLKLTVRSGLIEQGSAHTVSLNLQTWRLDNLRPDLLASLGIKPYRPADLTTDENGKLQWPPHLLTTTKYSPWYAVIPAMQQIWELTHLNFVILYKLATGVISWQSLGGPFSIFQSAMLAAQKGVVAYLSFLSLFSISIAILNLLPIPGLDGAQLFYLLIERIRGRPVSVALQVLAFRIGLIILCIFLLQLLLNDILRAL